MPQNIPHDENILSKEQEDDNRIPAQEVPDNGDVRSED